MKNSLKPFSLLGASIFAFLPLSLFTLSSVSAQSSQVKQAQEIPYPINDEKVIQFRQSCQADLIELYDFSEQDAIAVCNCTINKIHDDYTYHNSAITLMHFRHLVDDIKAENQEAIDIAEEAGYDCAVEEGFLYE